MRDCLLWPPNDPSKLQSRLIWFPTTPGSARDSAVSSSPSPHLIVSPSPHLIVSVLMRVGVRDGDFDEYM